MTNRSIYMTDKEDPWKLDTMHPLCHEAADAFWQYWKANGETHKHGYYESTWGAINAALKLVGAKKSSELRAVFNARLEDAMRETDIGEVRVHKIDPDDEREHVTDGSACWCNPEVISVAGKKRIRKRGA